MPTFFNLNSISKKLLFILMSVAISSIVTITFVFSAYELTTAKQEQISSIDTMLAVMSPNITAAVLFDDQEAIQELIDPMLLRTDIVSIKVINSNKQQIAVANRLGTDVLQQLGEPNDNLLLDFTQISAPLILENQSYGEIVIIADDSYFLAKINFYGYFIASLLLFTLGLSFFLSLYLRRRFLTPILHLAKVAQRVSESNNYSLRAKELSQDEVGQLSSCFNDMLFTIEQRDKQLESKVKRRTEELESANEKLHEYAYQDGLTNLPNRRYFYEKLQSIIAVPSNKFTLIFLDLDGFKEVNDTLGHDYGDQLLCQVAKRLRNCVREQDTVARLGGDEFTLIVEGVSSVERASQIAEIIKKSLMDPITINTEQVHVTGSIGLTFFPKDAKKQEELIKHADQAMYFAKNKGRNRYEFFSTSIERHTLEKHQLVEDLRQAIQKQQFELYYLPIMSIDGDITAKAEALLRWHHPTKGIIESQDFITDAQDHGLMRDIGHWVRQTVIKDLQHFHTLAESPIQICINTLQLDIDSAGEWAQQWIAALHQHNLNSQSILIEVTEQTLLTSDSSIQQHITQLSEHGVGIAIDDFGVGYSSLAYLQQFNIDMLKIDQSFITDVQHNDSNIALVRAIITMAHHLDVKVIAEGVANRGQYDLLEHLKCDFMQGSLFSEPLNKDVFINNYLRPPAITQQKTTQG